MSLKSNALFFKTFSFTAICCDCLPELTTVRQRDIWVVVIVFFFLSCSRLDHKLTLLFRSSQLTVTDTNLVHALLLVNTTSSSVNNTIT